MNKCILIGNLSTDVESRTTQSGIATCKFNLAVQRRFVNAQGVREADFLPVVCWRQTAELCSKYLQKGRKVAVEGSIQTRSYEAQDGSKRYVTEIIADNVEFLSSRGESKESGGVNHITQSVMNQARETFGSEFVEVDDELPF
jgi:single-strand DNA-binding protein